MTPLLTTPRLRLAPFSTAFLTTEYVQWLNDPDVVRFSEQRHRSHTVASATAYFQSFTGTSNHFWAIVRIDGNEHIGNITANVDDRNGVADVGILIGKKQCWGHGYGAEAWAAVCDYLLGAGGMRKVTGGAVAVNAGMLAIMRRCGMRDDGVRQRHLLIDGAEVDVVHMARFR